MHGVDDLLEIALRHMGEVFSGQIAAAPAPMGAGTVAPRRVAPEGMAMGATERGWPSGRSSTGRSPGLGTATLPGARALCVPLAGPRGAVGVLAIVPADGHAFEIPEALHQLETFANQTALAIERAQLADEARRAEVRAETERMRNSLLSSVSHDLRTPLATIIGASSGLLDGAERLDSATRRDSSAPSTGRPAISTGW